MFLGGVEIISRHHPALKSNRKVKLLESKELMEGVKHDKKGFVQIELLALQAGKAYLARVEGVKGDVLLTRQVFQNGATMPEATQPVRCMFWVKTGAFYGQEGAFWDQEGAALRGKKVRFGIKRDRLVG